MRIIKNGGKSNEFYKSYTKRNLATERESCPRKFRERKDGIDFDWLLFLKRFKGISKYYHLFYHKRLSPEKQHGKRYA